ncbi:hypothetical protein GGR56DRAFT_684566 [Xylariaceae sp. FL0804]|nr:hypothetical protein GGR56DRAFT_684566 [Xylariaceae sp. FL0804]
MPTNQNIMQLRELLLVIWTWATAISASGNTCYFKNGIATGVEAPGMDFLPCDPTNTQTHCCQSGSGTCLTNGLCFISNDSSLNAGACTDPTWSDASCFQFCGGDLTSTLYRCGTDDWCCANGVNGTSCCNDSDVNLFKISDEALIKNSTALAPGYYLASSVPASSSSSFSTSSAASSTTASTSSVCSFAPSPSSSSSPSSSGALWVGLGAGLGIGVPLAVAVATLYYLLARERRLARQLLDGGAQRKTQAAVDTVVTYYQQQQQIPQEMGALKDPGELQGS